MTQMTTMIENHQLQEETHLPVATEEFQSLDPRVIKLWRLNWLIGIGIIILVLLGAGIGIGYATPSARIWLAIGWLVLTTASLWFCLWFPPRYYRSWRWRIDAKVLEIRSGRLVERTRLIPLNRLQHVDLERGLFERMYGLSSLVIYTAGTHAASTSIPGLEAEAAARLRDHLVEIGGEDAV